MKEETLRRYERSHKKSKELFEKSKTLFPKGVCHDIRAFEPFPFVTEKAYDTYLLDVDGNRISDLWMGHYANILGHSSEPTKKALNIAAETAVHPGTLNKYQIEMAETLKEAVPELEMMRFCSSGTEATMYACRVARAFTSRPLVVKIEGGWHGGSTDLSYGVKHPYDKPSSLGVNVEPSTVSVPFNDIQKTSVILENLKDQIAAVITEPMLGAGGGIVMDREYAEMLRTFCDKNGSVLIFDEVITAFRFRYGSFWPYLGIKPDMFTTGKIIGGGIHLGMYGGRADIMKVIERENLIVGGGTYSANPVGMMAGKFVLDELKRMDYPSLNSAGDSMRDYLKSLIRGSGVNAKVTGFGSFFCIHFIKEDKYAAKLSTAELRAFTDKDVEAEFKILMLNENVFTMHSGGALSFAHLRGEKLEYIRTAYLKAVSLLK